MWCYGSSCDVMWCNGSSMWCQVMSCDAIYDAMQSCDVKLKFYIQRNCIQNHTFTMIALSHTSSHDIFLGHVITYHCIMEDCCTLSPWTPGWPGSPVGPSAPLVPGSPCEGEEMREKKGIEGKRGYTHVHMQLLVKTNNFPLGANWSWRARGSSGTWGASFSLVGGKRNIQHNWHICQSFLKWEQINSIIPQG